MVRLSQVEIVSQAAPVPKERINEDAWLFMPAQVETGRREYVIAAVMDGVSARLSHALFSLPSRHGGEHLTPGALAANFVRDSLCETLLHVPEIPLHNALLKVNARFRAYIDDLVPGGIAGLASTFQDERDVRLVLPACVLTLVRLHFDPHLRAIEYAHAGDTALLVVHKDGRVMVPTPDQMGRFDAQVVARGWMMAHLHDSVNGNLRDYVSTPEVRDVDIRNGMRHNYIDEKGQPHPSAGCGVIDGLPELSSYIVAGTIPGEDVDLICLVTDGMMWPPTADEVALLLEMQQSGKHSVAQARPVADSIRSANASDPQAEFARIENNRYAEMVRILRDGGMSGLLQRIRIVEQDDAGYDRFPRLKLHDDATGILMRFD